jgi:hypothetical protein
MDSRWQRLTAFLTMLIPWLSPSACAYSLLTHEQVVDIVWKDDFVPVLEKRFPDATEEDLRKAHAFAYGGCLLQDMGYYPLGNKFFSDLTHYVRSGDFIANLIAESTNLDEYAYALGALGHYSSDNTGHPYVNRAVALSFPKLRRKYGDSVSYEEDKTAHLRVEFGFDLAQVARNRYTPQSYHDFIGFEISRPVLERAFQKTYGMPLESVLPAPDLSISTFRRAVSEFMPELTQAAIIAEKPQRARERHTTDERIFRYMLSRSEYEKQWGNHYERPRLRTRLFALLLKCIPKIGPLKILRFKVPSTETEQLYVKSVDATVAVYRDELRMTSMGHIELPNMDFDLGNKSRCGEYFLSDEAYARLLDDLSREGFKNVDPDLRRNIIQYYQSGREPSLRSCKSRKQWEKTQSQLRVLAANGKDRASR